MFKCLKYSFLCFTFILIFFVASSSAHAAYSPDKLDEILEVNLPESTLPYHVIVWCDSTEKYYCYSASSPWGYYRYYLPSMQILQCYSIISGQSVESANCGSTYSYFDFSSGAWVYGDRTLSSIDLKSNDYTLVYSNEDIAWIEGSSGKWLKGDVFFRKPLPNTSLPKILKKANPGAVMKEILMMIPACLVFLVGYLGLRKALRMVLGILKKA